MNKKNVKDEKMIKLLETLAKTMNDISALWDENEDYSEIMSKHYPESLMSFDELTADISDWVEKTTWEIEKQKMVNQPIYKMRFTPFL